jgi:hypothetical protein
MASFWDDFQQWYSQPFSADMPAKDWFLFIGLLMVIVILWSLVLKHLGDLVNA